MTPKLPTLLLWALPLLALGILLPVDALARAIAAADDPIHAQIRVMLGLPATAPRVALLEAGIRMLKVLLIVHAALMLALPRLMRGRAGGAALLAGSPAVDEAPASRRAALALGAILLVAAVLRLVHLGDGLWFDEIQTLVEYARLPMLQIVSTYDSQNQHLLYTVLAHLSLAVTQGDWAVRLPAALFGIASVGALYWFATRVTSRREALLASALLAASSHHVWFSQNARGYTGLLCLTLVGSGLFLMLLRGERERPWPLVLAYAATMAAAHLIHVTAAFVTASHAAIWLVLALRAPATARAHRWWPALALLLAGTLTLLCYALVLPQLLDTLTAPTMPGVATEWKRPAWLVAEAARVLAEGVPLGYFGLAAGLVVGSVGLVSYARRGFTLLALMIAPLALTLVVVLVLSHNLWPRFFFFGAGFFVLVAVRGVLAIASSLLPARGAPLATAALALAALGSLWTVPRAWGPKQDYDAAFAHVARERAPTDSVVALDMAGYVGQFRHPGVARWGQSLDDVRSAESSAGRTWVVYTFATRIESMYPDLWRHLRDEYRPVAVYPGTVGGGAVHVLVRR